MSAQRRWLSPDEYGGLVALCQMVPGPASSQVGYLIGLRRAGWSGAFAAWAGFTLPSAIVMFGFALLAPHLEGPTTNAVMHGLKLVAVAVVAQAVWNMARNLCPDRRRAALALLAAALVLVVSGSFVQIAALLIGAIGGALLCRDLPAAPGLPVMPVSMRTGGAALALFLILLVALPLAGAAAPHSLLALAGIFYKAGALVFGGGHVVLPLLRDALVPQGWLSDNAFLAGYGVAQAIPGPLFTFSAYLGAVVAPACFDPPLVGDRADLHVSARGADRARRSAGMVVARPPPCGARRTGRDQRRRRRRSRGRTLQPDLVERRRQRPRCGDCRDRLSAARALAGAAARHRGFLRRRGVDRGAGPLIPGARCCCRAARSSRVRTPNCCLING